MMLDLKDTSPDYVDLVARFLNSRSPGRDVIVGSRSVDVLHTLSGQAPEAILLLSVSDAGTFEDLQANTALQDAIDGVTIRESLLDVDMAYWLENQNLLIIAWTVNDIQRVNELVQLGVDGITTDNLALITLLGTQQPGE
jgi:glycerophosphoryl diester phosphodiesterase